MGKEMIGNVIPAGPGSVSQGGAIPCDLLHPRSIPMWHNSFNLISSTGQIHADHHVGSSQTIERPSRAGERIHGCRGRLGRPQQITRRHSRVHLTERDGEVVPETLGQLGPELPEVCRSQIVNQPV